MIKFRTQIIDEYDKKKKKKKVVLVVLVPHLLATCHDEKEQNRITLCIIKFNCPSKYKH